eukprot:95198-Chlamydomonas_euryale.AAC.8
MVANRHTISQRRTAWTQLCVLGNSSACIMQCMKGNGPPCSPIALLRQQRTMQHDQCAWEQRVQVDSNPELGRAQQQLSRAVRSYVCPL